MYAMMDLKTKLKLCPQKSCSGWGVPIKLDSWTQAEGSEWREYAKEILTGADITFDHVPLNVSPFFQADNYMVAGKRQKPFPIPMLNDLRLKFNFHDHLDFIFKPIATNKNKYRFKWKSIRLHIQKLRLSKLFFAELMRRKTLMTYQGLTRQVRFETINHGDMIFRAKIQNTYLPEGVVVIALNQNLFSGTYKYASAAKPSQVFEDHNITQIQFAYNNDPFFNKEPHPGNFSGNQIERKAFLDAMHSPPFNVEWEQSRHNIKNVYGRNTNYPYIWLNFLIEGTKQRIVPINSEASVLAKPHDLDLVFTFGTGGATKDMTYLVYMYFSDNNLTYDPKSKLFGNPHLRKSLLF